MTVTGDTSATSSSETDEVISCCLFAKGPSDLQLRYIGRHVGRHVIVNVQIPSAHEETGEVFNHDQLQAAIAAVLRAVEQEVMRALPAEQDLG